LQKEEELKQQVEDANERQQAALQQVQSVVRVEGSAELDAKPADVVGE